MTDVTNSYEGTHHGTMFQVGVVDGGVSLGGGGEQESPVTLDQVKTYVAKQVDAYGDRTDPVGRSVAGVLADIHEMLQQL